MTTTDLSGKYPHLSEAAATIADAGNEVRIQAIQAGGWIGYERAKTIIARMEKMLAHPPIERMPHLLIVGDSNNGKTQILKRFLSKHPPNPNPDGDATITPVIFVRAPPTPDIGDLCVRILESVNAPYKEKGTPAERLRATKKVLKGIGSRVLLIDDIQHMLSGGPVKQREFRNSIKDLGNELSMSIIAAGIEDAHIVFATDPQLSNRFPIEDLALWKLSTETGRFLATLEKRLPLRKGSNLKDPALVQQIVFMSEGPIGEIHSVVKEAAIAAIEAGTEAITLEILNGLKWVRPSARKDRPSIG